MDKSLGTTRIDCEFSGSTAVVSLLRGTTLTTAWVGDSRCVLGRRLVRLPPAVQSVLLLGVLLRAGCALLHVHRRCCCLACHLDQTGLKRAAVARQHEGGLLNEILACRRGRASSMRRWP